MTQFYDRDQSPPARLPVMPDMPLIIEQIQSQLDDLRAVVENQQVQLTEQAARLAALERR